MLVQRRDLIAGLSALTAAGVLPAAQAKSPTARDQSRSVAYVPAAHLPEDEHAIHRRHMSVAIDLAETVPFSFGVVIVDRARQRIVAKGANAGAENPIFHGEIMAIINCAKANPDVKWEDLTIYSSGEPCPMCQWPSFGQAWPRPSMARRSIPFPKWASIKSNWTAQRSRQRLRFTAAGSSGAS